RHRDIALAPAPPGRHHAEPVAPREAQLVGGEPREGRGPGHCSDHGRDATHNRLRRSERRTDARKNWFTKAFGTRLAALWAAHAAMMSLMKHQVIPPRQEFARLFRRRAVQLCITGRLSHKTRQKRA